MDHYSLEIGVRRIARVFARIRCVGSLYEQVAGCDVSLLRDDTHATARRIIVNFLKASKMYCRIEVRL